MGQAMDERKERERSFHDARFSATEARAADRFYSITGGSRHAYDAKLLDVEPGARVLEFGCGPGSSALALAERGAIITGIDISPVAVDLATRNVAALGAAISFVTMDAEALEFADDSFDVVCGAGILHHLSLDRAFGELTRVLHPGGRAFFIEPLGHNPVLNWYRNRTPDQRTEDEHPLVLPDFTLAKSFFGDVHVSYHHLATLAAIPLCSTRIVEPLARALDALDRGLFAIAPSIRRFAWVAVLELGRPQRAALT
jgi:SAM-dependent methyltransferase